MFDLKRFRKENKLTQSQLGEKLGYTHSYISNIENGKEPVTDKFLDKLNEAFNIEVDKFKSYNVIEGEGYTVVVEEQSSAYGKIASEDWESKYILLEKEHMELMKKYIATLEEIQQQKSKVTLGDKPISK